MNKYLYKIKDLEIPPWIKYWFVRKSKINFDLSQILNGTNFDLENSVNKKLHLINIFGNSIQNGEPTPENPIEIKSSGDNGSITEKFVNKNLYLGNAKQSASNRLGLTAFKVKPNTVYTLNSSNNNIQVINYYKDYNKDDIINNNWQTLPYTFTTPTNCYYLAQIFRNSNNVDISLTDLTDYQIEEGSIATEYEPHQEQLYTIPCQQPMRAIGDVKDTFVKIDEVWYERHNIGEFIANDNLLGNGITDDRVNLRTPVLDIQPNLTGNTFKKNVMCNLLQKSVVDKSGLGGTTSTGEIRVILSKNYATTYSEANTYLAEKALKIHWVKEEPIDLPCTQAQITALEQLQKAKTYKDVTHIYTDDEVPADLEIQYYKEKGE